MSVVTLLTRRQPTLDGIAFDATIESTFTASVEVTGYPMESGARAVDHALIMPLEYTMTIMASNNPLKPNVTDFIGGALSNFINLPIIAGLSAGFLSGRPDTHAAAVLTDLVGRMVTRDPVEIYGGDITLKNMLITSVERTRTPENENGLEAVITFQELAELKLIHGAGLNNISTDTNDPASTAAGRAVNTGLGKIKDAGNAVNERAAEVFSFG